LFDSTETSLVILKILKMTARHRAIIVAQLTSLLRIHDGDTRETFAIPAVQAPSNNGTLLAAVIESLSTFTMLLVARKSPLRRKNY